MKERPIMFSALMVRAILDGRKTQTRRVVKVPEKSAKIRTNHGGLFLPNSAGDQVWIECPYGQPGDRLWVRETHDVIDEFNKVVYRADEPNSLGDDLRWSGKWKPSIFMPRWASRITLEITGVRVERLNEISEADAQAEGVKALDGQFAGCYAAGPALSATTAKECFMRLWESINGPGSWEANPWVWAIEFKPITP